MSDTAREEEGQPPAKKLKTEASDDKDESVGTMEGVEEETGEMGEGGGAGEEGQYPYLAKLKEEDVGITEYISQHKGFNAIIKQRYSDFIVNEVSKAGEIVHLTNTDIPVAILEAEPCGPVDEVIPEEFLAQLKQIASRSNPGMTASIQAGDDKNWRLRMHRAVKSAFPDIETKTEEKDGVKVITAMFRGKGRDNRRVDDSKQWPKGSRFCRFTLYKENRTTMEVIHLLAKFLKVKDGAFRFAGTKDKRAKTTQEVTAFKVLPKRLQDLNKFLRNAKLGNFSFAEDKLSLGDLNGNHFTVVLRNVIGDDADIEAGLASLKKYGFINYYGMQRFGSARTSTFEIGRALLKEEWEQAVDMIIGCAIEKDDQPLEFQEIWRKTRNPESALKACKVFNFIERTLFRSLAKKPFDYFGAIQFLPRSVRLLYPHSYQSLVWNTIASRRIKTFGLKTMVGDLVFPPDSASQMEDVSEEQGAEVEDADKMEDGDKVEDADKMEEADKAPVRKKVQPIVLDETNVNQYTIHDVVLPLPGYDVIYPNNEVRQWYKEFLEKDGFDIENMRRKQKDYSLSGNYRAIMILPKDVEYKMLQYDDVTAPLCLSDLDRMNDTEEPQSLPDGKLKAIQLSFTLGMSAYATMALRELLKADTSPSKQASLNVS